MVNFFAYTYPALYLLFEFTSVVLIKAAAEENGEPGYNTASINLITECIKLCLALYFTIREGSLPELRKTSRHVVISFGVSNMMYALNNNIYHISMSWFNPALFALAINCLRTMLTSGMQQFVSGQKLTRDKVIACILLVIGFLVSGVPDIAAASKPCMVVVGGNSGSSLSIGSR